MEIPAAWIHAADPSQRRCSGSVAPCLGTGSKLQLRIKLQGAALRPRESRRASLLAFSVFSVGRLAFAQGSDPLLSLEEDVQRHPGVKRRERLQLRTVQAQRQALVAPEIRLRLDAAHLPSQPSPQAAAGVCLLSAWLTSVEWILVASPSVCPWTLALA